MFNLFQSKPTLVDESKALKGRDEPIVGPLVHAVNKSALSGPWPAGSKVLWVAMGCFWGAERIFWKTEGVVSTAVGYQGGYTKNPTYEEVCSGQTAHTEVVQVVFNPDVISLQRLLVVFWESHDPTQGYRQGNDRGTQYRSAVYVSDEQELKEVLASRERYQDQLSKAGLGSITTEIGLAKPFYYAEAYHQQYLAKNPQGYCGIGGTGVSCPVGVGA